MPSETWLVPNPPPASSETTESDTGYNNARSALLALLDVDKLKHEKQSYLSHALQIHIKKENLFSAMDLIPSVSSGAL